MSDLRWLRPVLGFGLLGVAAMTVLAPAVALLRGTTGHDWYVAPKLTAVEVALAVGFDHHAPVVEYRTRNGSVERTSRRTFYFEGEAWGARQRILVTTRDHELPDAARPCVHGDRGGAAPDRGAASPSHDGSACPARFAPMPGVRGALNRASTASRTWPVTVRPKRASHAAGIAPVLSIVPVAVPSAISAPYGAETRGETLHRVQ